MCGIFAIINDKSGKAAQTTLEGLKKLEYRGYDSWGVAVINEKSISIEKHVGKIGDAVTNLPDGTMAVGHTRWATHGGVTDENAHPHLDCSGKIVVIHNGIVENYQELKAGLKKHNFKSETDTEVIAHLIENEKKIFPFEKAVLRVFKKLIGSNAIVVLDALSETIVACRNGSPLACGFGDKQYFLASDVTAFLKFTSKVLFLNDGEAVVMKNTGFTLFDLKTEKEKMIKTITLNWKAEDAQKAGYNHFLLKEIMEQKITIPKTVFLNRKEMEKIKKNFKNYSRIIFTGCGTAYHCCLLAKYFFSQAGIKTEAIMAYEFLPFTKFIDKKTVVFAVSQSGETADTLIACREAKKQGANLAAVVNARGSTLERMADFVLAVGAGPEIAVVSTKAFTSQLTALYLLSKKIIGKDKVAKRELGEAGEKLDRWLGQKLLNEIMDLAKKIIDENDMYVIGKHENYPAGLEFGLKIKESSYIHAEAFASGELKHGVITLISQGTPCFVLGANDETKLELLSSAAELKARGGKIIGVAPFKAPEFDLQIQTPDLGSLTILGNIIAGQLLGYYLGVGRGTDPDKPRNLAKSVTVK